VAGGVKIPTVEVCLQHMADFGMLENIKAHSRVVARVAELLTASIAHQGEPLNMDLVIGAALLHDIAKTQCLESRCDHARVGSEICRELGYAEIAAIVAEHVLITGNGCGRITEKEIVYYADKRVNHDRIVSLHDRLDYILDRYGRNDEARHESIRLNFDKCLKMERHIFANLAFSPDQVASLVMSRNDWRV
jgi:putative nucleotidyltransferase with HDIG domain